MPNQYVFLFPSDFLNNREPDFDYKNEYEAAKRYFTVVLINQEKLFDRNEVSVNLKISNGDVVIYRGWMLKPTQYALLVAYVTHHGGRMFTDQSAYEYTHLLPNWMQGDGSYVPAVWTEDLSDAAIRKMLSRFSGAVTIKDYVKSRKFEWSDAFYIPDVADEQNALRVIHNFISRQGDDLVGGLVIREFVDLKSIGEHPQSHTPIFEEYRVFYMQRKPLVIIDYWRNDVVELSETDLHIINRVTEQVASDFYTVDFVRSIDGKLIVMEMGDGQVSGLQNYDEQRFYDAIKERLLD
ncbi:ATP-grasp domain-containing protein [Weissella confusa]|uniref:ATP-grasp domain-containing protein n=1 Tax=Weissella confusa TaxID=1583 RepID=UPI00107F9EE4|nr:ATP-grasp domain-containing protein [Weissella confusa]MBD1491203.1 hypothetical protein [Weissella confusa]MBD5833507.1 hypothetical protein [Weissella confusa]MBJ7622071.1 ATP-grasp domain-containing protein [Weissella confusa]MBJ7630302.1 ATP-grasp domain-containing protein [Weissella confusa]MBJ7634097.1 ATP-grasp domain-containing protein [Weissella confusa]